MTAWRTHPELTGLFHSAYPDDLLVLVHDGEARRSGRPPEACWVRVTGIAGPLDAPLGAPGQMPPLPSAAARRVPRTVFTGTLLHPPAALTSVRAGQGIYFVRPAAVPCPILVTQAYLNERPRWGFSPCDACGVDETFDPPSTMAQTRFPTAPAGTVPLAFSANCTCGGRMMVTALS